MGPGFESRFLATESVSAGSRAEPLTGQVRDGDACMEWLPIAFPFTAGPRVRIRLPPAESPRLVGFCPPTVRSRLFARVCGPNRCSAVSRDGYRAMHGADRREYLCRAKFQYRGVDEAVA
jgi:hypothetical protein